jgi:alpha-ketoglutarate-dependent taurine dioxygenase
MKIWFLCLTPPQQGGETPVIDCRTIYKLLDPAIRRRFENKKLMYVRNYTSGLDVSWQSFFRTSDRAAVEDYCRRAGIACEWKNGNGLRTRQVCRAIVKHPQTGEQTFFNQIQLHHVACLEPAVREALLSTLSVEDLPRNVYYGDGSTIEDSVVAEISELYRSNCASFAWQRGDVLMLNNMLVAHARNPYVGERKIVVAMGEMIEQSDVG